MGSLKQGSGWHSHPEAFGCLVFELSETKIYSTFDGFLKMLINVCIIEASGVVGATPQKFINCPFVVAPQKL